MRKGLGKKKSTKKPPTFKTCNSFLALEVADLIWDNTQDNTESLKSTENYSTHDPSISLPLIKVA